VSTPQHARVLADADGETSTTFQAIGVKDPTVCGPSVFNKNIYISLPRKRGHYNDTVNFVEIVAPKISDVSVTENEFCSILF